MGIYDTSDDPNRVGNEDYRPLRTYEERRAKDEATADERQDEAWLDRRHQDERAAAAESPALLREVFADFNRIFGVGK